MAKAKNNKKTSAAGTEPEVAPPAADDAAPSTEAAPETADAPPAAESPLTDAAPPTEAAPSEDAPPSPDVSEVAPAASDEAPVPPAAEADAPAVEPPADSPAVEEETPAAAGPTIDSVMGALAQGARSNGYRSNSPHCVLSGAQADTQANLYKVLSDQGVTLPEQGYVYGWLLDQITAAVADRD